MDKAIIEEIRRELIQNADEKTKASATRFFREPVTLYGVKVPTVSKIGTQYFKKVKNESKHDIFALCEILFSSTYFEDAIIASEWAYAVHPHYEISDMAIFERWIYKFVTNWAVCDSLCNHAVGALVEQYPSLVKTLKIWTKSPNRWMKRAAAVSLVLPARKGLFLQDIFEIAETMLQDPDDLVQKGYGWMLKEASKAHQKEVFDFVIAHKVQMPRTALRYAIEKMPESLRKEAMARD